MTKVDSGYSQETGTEKAGAFQIELDSFRHAMPGLLKSDPGKFALVKGEQISTWDTLEAALDAGYERFGLEPFMVKEIVEHEKAQYFSRNVIRCRS